MEFRPCIDIHNGSVKQIVGGSLKDKADYATENFVSRQDAAFYARLYKDSGIKGGEDWKFPRMAFSVMPLVTSPESRIE